MGDFLQHNGLALLSLVIALTGGVPGMLSFVEYRRKRPKLAAGVANITYGIVGKGSGSSPPAMVFLTLTVGNDGELPLNPYAFDLELRHGGKRVSFMRQLIPADLSLQSSVQRIVVHDPASRDLQRFRGSITRADPVAGYLLFFTTLVSRDELMSITEPKFTLLCFDMLGRTFKADLEIKLEEIEGTVMFPKHALQVEGQ